MESLIGTVVFCGDESAFCSVDRLSRLCLVPSHKHIDDVQLVMLHTRVYHLYNLPRMCLRICGNSFAFAGLAAWNVLPSNRDHHRIFQAPSSSTLLVELTVLTCSFYSLCFQFFPLVLGQGC